ncbi:dTMP kinase [Sulfuracidifex tepidarius]|uniref:Probable thymidylate kinase n=1 Tax=Sulfuracidifex tepidarius TaxID=1294262 RepID=A0A510E3S0_9CREN|nr:dTMP kinase [Sulfuracidifex tepidarius]BBG23965.1 putative thymidylate kinase [Sulfuracidifex tepidarius]BBG26720.1 putative thymidylate kinase [Sulfuracidifex tepidarius]
MFLVSIEGIDGSGKTTLALKLVERLQKTGRRSLYTKEPFTPELTGMIERLGWNDPVALTLLFSADRRIHVKWMEEQNAEVVITDRYVHSTIAYQSAMGIEKEWIALVNSKFPQPQLTVLLDVDPNVAVSRIKKGDIFDFPEKRRLLEKVREKYLELARGDTFLVVDANRPIEEIQERVFTYLLERLP